MWQDSGATPGALILHLQSAGAFFVPKIMEGGVVICHERSGQNWTIRAFLSVR